MIYGLGFSLLCLVGLLAGSFGFTLWLGFWVFANFWVLFPVVCGCCDLSLGFVLVLFVLCLGLDRSVCLLFMLWFLWVLGEVCMRIVCAFVCYLPDYYFGLFIGGFGVVL